VAATGRCRMAFMFIWLHFWSLADEEDEHDLDLAMNGRAEMFVTDKHDFVEAFKTFKIEVITPAAALRRLR
jgi:predicted nucleic acid-binding protein